MALDTRFGAFFSAVLFCMAGYWVNLLPYLAVSRSCFIYHYIPALVYGEMLTALLLEHLLPRATFRYAYKFVLLAVCAAYLYYAPWVYALPLTNDGHARRRWLPRWD